MSPFDEQVTDSLQRLFAATGRRCYLIGALHGGFPDLGHHLPGEMGGLWVPPVKLADGFWFGISGHDTDDIEWMHSATCGSFTMRPGQVEREYFLTQGGATIRAVQQLFVPDEEAGMLVDVILHNTSEVDARITLHWLVRWDIQGAWWSHWPDRADAVHYDDDRGVFTAWDSGHEEWCGAMLSDRKPDRHEMGTDLWGPEHTGSLIGEKGVHQGGILPNPDELQGAGISARFDYELLLQPGKPTTLHFALAGGTGGPTPAAEKAADLIARRDELLSKKLAGQDALLEAASRIETPQPDMDRAYTLQNFCLDMMTMEAPGVARGAMAGLPSFVWFFGCDTYYSASGLLMAGQTPAALSTLRLLANRAREQSGRVPHEITPTGTLFNPGNPVETGQFVTAVERTYRWTGDRAFLEETYEVCKRGIFDYLLGECDPNGTLLPDGPGLLELRSAGRGKKLDVAAALYQGLRSLAYLASSVGDPQTADQSRDLQERVRHAIDEHFWVEERGEYVWRIEQDLTVSPDEPTHSYAMMEMGVLDGSNSRDADRAAALFERVEGPEHTGPKGIIHPGTTDFVMPIQNAIVALAELQYGRADRGLWYLQRMSDLCGQAMPWAIPEFEAPEGSDKSCFMQLWSSAAYNWLMVQGWFRIQPDPDRGVALVRPQLPAGWQFARVRNLTLWDNRYDLSLERVGGQIEFSATPLTGTDNPFRVEIDPGLVTMFV